MSDYLKEHSKTIRYLVKNAEKGVLEAQFQLYEYYDLGKYVDKDEKLADRYFAMYVNSLSSKKIHLESLKMWMFRRFHSIDISFDEKMTVIIGDNGAGKTSFADAIAKTFSWFNNNIEKDDVNGRLLIEDDVNSASTDFSEVISFFSLGKKNRFEAALARPVIGYTGSKSNDVSIIKRFGRMYRKAACDKRIIIPLLAFYSVDRSNISLKKPSLEKAFDDKERNRFYALKDALDGSGKLDNFSELYIELVNLASGKDTKEIRDLREQISLLERSIYGVYENKTPPDNDPFIAKLNDKKEELSIFLKSLSLTKYQKHLNFVNKAIESLVPSVKNLRVDRSLGRPRIIVDNFGVSVNITQLSQGQKVLVALTGDLARRLVILNPEVDNPLEAHGIVVIDEVELHLHPRWQQDILIGLQKTFPHLQFIVTTHSPQVLSTVDKKLGRRN
nr:retron Ec78 anti-phage system effector ATPase PtuA [Halomonas sp. UBA3074]